MKVWEELACRCREAKGYYDGKYNSKQWILNQGAVNFDMKYRFKDENEKRHYRVDYYVSRAGYMNMHLAQNLEVLKYCFADGVPASMLFVDMGCGPMTAGLALAEVLSGHDQDCRDHTTYFGIDASNNMVAKARYINDKYRLFAPRRFSVVHGSGFDASMLPVVAGECEVAVLWLSFVLAVGTWNEEGEAGESVEALARMWHNYIVRHGKCRETLIVYMNPVFGNRRLGMHGNWFHEFCPEMLGGSNTDGVSYVKNTQALELLDVPSLSKSVAVQIIRGTRS